MTTKLPRTDPAMARCRVNYKKFFQAKALFQIETFINVISKDNRIDVNKGTRIVKTGTQISGPSFDLNDSQNGLSIKKVALFYKREINTNISETNQITKSMLSKLKVVVLCCFCNNTVSVSLVYFATTIKRAKGYRCFTCKISHPLLVKLINESDVDPENNDTKDNNNSNSNNNNNNDNDNDNDNDNNNGDHSTLEEILARKLLSLQLDVQQLNTHVKLEESTIRELTNDNQQLKDEIQDLTAVNHQLEGGIEALSINQAHFEQELMIKTAEYVPSENLNELLRLTQDFSCSRVPFPQSNVDGWINLYRRCVSVDALKNQTQPTELPPTNTTTRQEGVDFIHLGDGDSKGRGAIGFMTIIFGRETMIRTSTILLKECAIDPLKFREKYFSASDHHNDDRTTAR